jgi:hypothetical protein
MPPTALVTVQLDGWPPPTVEIHALIAALPQHEPGSDETPANAIQHLNEVILAFPTSETDSTSADARVRAIARGALSSIYTGPFRVVRARITP